MSSLYYDPYNSDVDLMNLLMEKHGRALGMVKFRDIKIACGFEEEISCEGGAQITRWVKRRPACSILESAKKDVDPETAKEEAVPAAAAAPAPSPRMASFVTTEAQADGTRDTIRTDYVRALRAEEALPAPPRVQRRRRINRGGIMATASTTHPGCFEDIECQDHGTVCESVAFAINNFDGTPIPVATWKCPQCGNQATFSDQTRQPGEYTWSESRRKYVRS